MTKNLFQNIYHSCAVLASGAGLRGAEIVNEDEECVCVCVCDSEQWNQRTSDQRLFPDSAAPSASSRPKSSLSS